MRKLILIFLLFLTGTVCFASHNSSTTVPTKNSVLNVSTRDVIGNKTDDDAGNSIYSKVYLIEKHQHSVAKVYPMMTNGVTVAKDNTAWTYGAYAVVVPTNVITNPFDIHSINFDSISANGTFSLSLYGKSGGVYQELGRTRFTRTSVQDIANDSTFMTPIIDANSTIDARLAGSATGTDNVVITIRYHEY